MCRMLGYVGPALPLAELVSKPPHSLLVQSYRPREMTSGTVNADGYGAALWLDDGREEPALYRTAAPIWADPNLGWMGERLRVRAALAAVRSATPGIGYELPNVQPFARGPLAFVHNGFIERFQRGPKRAICDQLGRAAYEAIAGSSDSEHLFALLLDVLDRQPGASLADAVRGAVSRLARLCDQEGVDAVATLIVSDGATLVGCRYARRTSPASLYLAPLGGQAAGTSVAGAAAEGWCMASEPLDQGSPRWQPLAPGSICVVRSGAAPLLEPLL